MLFSGGIAFLTLSENSRPLLLYPSPKLHLFVCFVVKNLRSLFPFSLLIFLPLSIITLPSFLLPSLALSGLFLVPFTSLSLLLLLYLLSSLLAVRPCLVIFLPSSLFSLLYETRPVFMSLQIATSLNFTLFEFLSELSLLCSLSFPELSALSTVGTSEF